MFDTVLDAFADATGCDRSALGVLVGAVREPGELKPERLMDRGAATERAIHAMQATQARDLAAFAERRHAQDVAEQVPDHLQGRTAAVEVAAELRVATMTAQHQLHQASRAVDDHPRLLALVGTGVVSMPGCARSSGPPTCCRPSCGGW